MLKVYRKHNSLVSCLTGKLHAKIPRVEGNESEFEALGCQMLGSKCVKAVDGVSERPCCPYMLPGESGEARLWKISPAAADSIEFGGMSE